MPRTRSLLLSLCLLPLACQTGNDEEPTSNPRSAVASESLAIHLALPADAQPDRIEAIGRHVEGLADVAAASIRIEKTPEATGVTVEVWGADLPTPAWLEADLRQSFPELASAGITIGPADATKAPVAMPSLEGIEDPAEAEQAIRDELEAQGVDGNVKVEVRDDEDGNREVEVRVEKHEEK